MNFYNFVQENAFENAVCKKAVFLLSLNALKTPKIK